MKLVILFTGYKDYINSTSLIFNPRTTFFLLHDVKIDIGNNSKIPKELNYKFYSNYLNCLVSFISIIFNNNIKSVVLADHTPLAFIIEIICRIRNIYVTRYCGSNLIGAAILLRFPLNIIGLIYAIINGFSFANKILANNKRSFWRYFWTKKTKFINSSFFPKALLINNKFLEKDKNYDICIVGHLNRRKRILELIEWINSNIHETKQINIIGSGSLVTEAKSLASKSIHNYSFHGSLNKSNTLEILARSKFFMINSLSEGYPRVVSEAISLGCIAICPKDASYYSTLWNKQMLDYETFKTNIKNIDFFNYNHIINLTSDEETFISNILKV